MSAGVINKLLLRGFGSLTVGDRRVFVDHLFGDLDHRGQVAELRELLLFDHLHLSTSMTKWPTPCWACSWKLVDCLVNSQVSLTRLERERSSSWEWICGESPQFPTACTARWWVLPTFPNQQESGSCLSTERTGMLFIYFIVNYVFHLWCELIRK